MRKTSKSRKLWLTLVFLLIFHSTAEGVNPPANLWKGLIAEDTSGSYESYLAIALVVRNRLDAHMNHGLCALKRKNLDSFIAKEVNYAKIRYNKDLVGIAQKAISDAFSYKVKDITGGANHYEYVERYGKPKWARNMVVTTKIGNHTFYKGR